MKPVCFMVMPFRRKAVTQAESGAPREVNFDRLWDAAFRPVLEQLGYLPVRADLESGSVIVKEMLNRLRHADLVLADVSISNGNVYYEVGIRHAAQETRCVCIAADWFKPLFDIAQFRVLTYPLSDTEVTDAGATAIRDLLVKQLPGFVPARTPYYDLTDQNVEKAFTERAESISAFQGELQSVRLTRRKEARATSATELVKKYSAAASNFPGVTLELVYLVRDCLNWQSVREFVERLPAEAARTEAIQEQYFLALSELGEHEKAIAGLQELNRRFGATPERCGIIGGRFKRLFREERKRRREAGEEQPSVNERYYLNQAIQSYEEGMLLDLNEYYCAGNLPGLLRDRGRNEDQERATAIDTQVVAACRRAEKMHSQDPFLADTLFGTAFRQGDLAALEAIVEEVEAGIPWRLGTTLHDAEEWIQQASAAKRPDLMAILGRLRTAVR